MPFLTDAEVRLAIANRDYGYDFASGIKTRRTALVVFADSNGGHQDHGYIKGLDTVSESMYQIFGFGVRAAGHGVLNDWGSRKDLRRATIPSGSAVYPSSTVALTTATWTAATKTLTKVGGFTNYVHATGNTIENVTGTGVVDDGPHLIASKISNDAITLATEIAPGNLVTGDIAATVYNSPPEFRDLINFPQADPSIWLPNQGVYIGPGNTAFTSLAAERWSRRGRAIGVNGPLKMRILHALHTTAGGGFRYDAVSLDQAQAIGAATTAGSETQFGTGSTKSTTGTLGELKWDEETAGFTTDADRIASGSNLIDWTTGYSVTNTGPVCLLYTHLDNPKRSFGLSVQAFMHQGGRSRLDMANCYLNLLPTATKNTYWRAVVDQFKTTNGGNDTGAIGIPFFSSFNDFAASETGSSLGPSPAASNTPAGFTDNLRALVEAIDADIVQACDDEGLDPANIARYYLPCCEHALATTPTAAPAAYVTNTDCAGWGRLGHRTDRALASSLRGTYNIIPVDLSQLATWTELCNNRHLDIGADGDPTSTTNDRHGQPGLYNLLSARLFAALDHWPTRSSAAAGVSYNTTRRPLWAQSPSLA